IQGGLVGKLTKKYGEGFVIQIGIVVSAIGFGLILFINSFATAAVFLTIFGIGNGVIRPSVSALLTKVSTTLYGITTDHLSSVNSLRRIIGTQLDGWLFAIVIGLPYLSGIALSVIALFLFSMYKLRCERNQSASSVTK